MYPTTLNLYVHPNFDQKKRCINTCITLVDLIIIILFATNILKTTHKSKLFDKK